MSNYTLEDMLAYSKTKTFLHVFFQAELFFLLRNYLPEGRKIYKNLEPNYILRLRRVFILSKINLCFTNDLIWIKKKITERCLKLLQN